VQRAIQRLKRQGYTNVEVRVGNGYAGWPEYAPFNKMMVTAAPDLIPPPLINQLKISGRMVIPVGLLGAQQLVVVEKDLNGKVNNEGNYAGTILGARGDGSTQDSTTVRYMLSAARIVFATAGFVTSP
jgi:protein-L-isoaspartate O-methyltransferase